MALPIPSCCTQLVASSNALAYSSAICSLSAIAMRSLSKAFSVAFVILPLIFVGFVLSEAMKGSPGLYGVSERSLARGVAIKSANRSVFDCRVGVDVREDRADDIRVGVVGGDMSTLSRIT